MGLRERRHRRVVVDVYGRTEPLRQQVAERQVPQRHVDGRDDAAGLEVDH